MIERAAPELLPRYAEAVAVVKEQQRASVSLVQRRLRISWDAARDLIELMLERGDVPLDWAPQVYQLAGRRTAGTAPEGPEEAPACWCHVCNKDVTVGGWPYSMTTMILCPTCGNKRCPKASDHALACTGSNEPGQSGSAYAAPSHSPAEEDK